MVEQQILKINWILYLYSLKQNKNNVNFLTKLYKYTEIYTNKKRKNTTLLKLVIIKGLKG